MYLLCRSLKGFHFMCLIMSLPESFMFGIRNFQLIYKIPFIFLFNKLGDSIYLPFCWFFFPPHSFLSYVICKFQLWKFASLVPRLSKNHLNRLLLNMIHHLLEQMNLSVAYIVLPVRGIHLFTVQLHLLLSNITSHQDLFGVPLLFKTGYKFLLKNSYLSDFVLQNTS